MNLLNLFQKTEDAQDFQVGTTVFAEGTPGDLMYVVLDGELEILTVNGLIDVIGPGDVIGEMALIDSKVRNNTVVAKSDCRLLPVDKKRFMFMVRETPFFALQVMRVLADRLRRCQIGSSPVHSQSLSSAGR